MYESAEDLDELIDEELEEYAQTKKQNEGKEHWPRQDSLSFQFFSVAHMTTCKLVLSLLSFKGIELRK